MSTKDLVAVFLSVSQKDLIAYLPELSSDSEEKLVEYVLMYKNKRIKRIKARSLTDAFKALATVNLGHNTALGYYYNCMSKDTMEQMLCYKELSTAEFLNCAKKDPNFVKRFILEWMIDECRENDIMHIERLGDAHDYSSATWDATTVIAEPIDTSKIIVEERQSSEPPSFEEFVKILKSRASRQVKEYYQVTDYDELCIVNGTPIREMLKSLIFRGNLWQVFCDINNVLTHDYFFLDMYEMFTNIVRDEQKSFDAVLDEAEKYLGDLITLRRVTMYKRQKRRTRN